MTQRISRFGSYGIVIQDHKILLTRKRSGPYTGLWGLPGGGIEFSETPEEALIREILEEAAYSASGLALDKVVTHTTSYQNKGIVEFHQVGVLYQVNQVVPVADCVAEEEVMWGSLAELSLQQLTPFAQKVVAELQSPI